MASDPPIERYVEALGRLFPVTVPETSVWTDVDAIAAVVAELAACGVTWAVAPDGREALLCAASAGEAPATIEVTTDRGRYLLQPQRLVLESFEGHALTFAHLSTFPMGRLDVGEHLALAEHNRVRVNGGNFVFFCAGSPLRRAATDRNYAAWDADRMKRYVMSLQETMLAETGSER